MKYLHDRGYECYLVGGAVRNLILGNQPSDFDFATNAPPEQVMATYRRVIPTGIQHGTVTVLFRGASFEVTTYRTESAYSDTRRPDHVEFVGRIEEDLERRDFTMNAMAFDPLTRTFLDPHHGEQDIHARIVRAIGDPAERFSEDALRMLRAVRFATGLEFSVHAETLGAIRACAQRIQAVSQERIRDELSKIVVSPRPSEGFRMLLETGLLSLILPELAEGVGVEQRGNHRFDVFEHSIRACDAAPADDLVVRLAALLHDIGKPRTMVEEPDGTRRFHSHEHVSAEMTGELLRRLRFPNRTIDAVVHLVRQHMFNYTPQWSDAAIRRFIARVGRDEFPRLVALRAADSEAIRGERIDTRPLEELAHRVREHLSADSAVSIGDLAVNGRDLMEAGIPPGPAMGVVLRELLNAVLDDPTLNTKPRLLEIARRFSAERIEDPES